MKGTLHWVNAKAASSAEFRLYEAMMLDDPNDGVERDFVELMNPDSITVKHGYVEPALAAAKPGDKFQFMRIGYFCTDLDHTSEHPVFNRAVGLKDSFKM